MSITSNTPETVTLVKEDTANKNTFRVTLNLDNPTITTTTNGTVLLTSDNYINNVSLVTNVVPASQTKTVTITENGTTAITPDNNIPYLDSVIVNTNVPQYKIDSIKIKQNGSQLLATVAQEIINITEDTDITNLIPTDGKLHKIETTSTSYIYLTITQKENCQFILFRYYSNTSLFIYEMETGKPFGIYENTNPYILKLSTEGTGNTGLIYFCKGTTIDQTTELISYDSEKIGSETNESEFKMAINLNLISENFPIQ